MSPDERRQLQESQMGRLSYQHPGLGGRKGIYRAIDIVENPWAESEVVRDWRFFWLDEIHVIKRGRFKISYTLLVNAVREILMVRDVVCAEHAGAIRHLISRVPTVPFVLVPNITFDNRPPWSSYQIGPI